MGPPWDIGGGFRGAPGHGPDEDNDEEGPADNDIGEDETGDDDDEGVPCLKAYGVSTFHLRCHKSIQPLVQGLPICEGEREEAHGQEEGHQ